MSGKTTRRGFITHELVNSLGVLASLGLGGITAWHQFMPETDRLLIRLTGPNNADNAVSLVSLDSNATTGSPYEDELALGPVSWTLEIYNRTDRAVAVTDVLIAISRENHTTKWSIDSGRGLAIGLFNREGPVPLPLNLQPREGRELAMVIRLPVAPLEERERHCEDQLATFAAFRSCLSDSGRQLSGADVAHGYYEIDGTTWVGSEPWMASDMYVEVNTAEGRRYISPLRYGVPSVAVVRRADD